MSAVRCPLSVKAQADPAFSGNGRRAAFQDWELHPDVQSRVNELLEQITTENFKEVVDYQGCVRILCN